MSTDTNTLSKIDEIIPNVSLNQINKIIATSSAKASAIAVLPVPIIDIAGVTYVQLRMVNDLAEIYGVNSGDKTKIIISSLVTNLISNLVTSATEELAATANIDKILGESLIKATISGFLTTVTGEVYADHFKNGGGYEDISIKGTIDYIKRQLNSDRVSVDSVAQIAMSSINNKFDI